MSVTQQIFTPYSQPADVAGRLNTNFTASTNVTYSMVQDIIMDKDSFIDEATGRKFRLNFVQDELYDVRGIGPRAGVIILLNHPAIAIQRLQWYDGTKWQDMVQLPPNDPAVTSGALQSFFFYPDRGRIEFHKLRTTQIRQGARVSYSWGHTAPPYFIRDLSAWLAAYEVHRRWGGQFSVAEDVSEWKRDTREQIQTLLWQAGIHSVGIIG